VNAASGQKSEKYPPPSRVPVKSLRRPVRANPQGSGAQFFFLPGHGYLVAGLLRMMINALDELPWCGSAETIVENRRRIPIDDKMPCPVTYAS